MDNPKQRYPRSVARRLRPHPCPDCQKISRPRITELPDLDAADTDPDVLVVWNCPDNLCNQHEGFYTETR
ncbi:MULTISPECIES: hypothetical protein [Streptomyces]|uniref:HNH endonuclease n=1 Tax=Streptomyces bacillaris TaxID=68179 RepID=A0ABW6DQ80_9ACTN|nr:hypothetical protein [Streptomyces nanshensis]